MEKYLGSGLIKGIGQAFAQRLVSAFSDQVFEVIEHTPQRLLDDEPDDAARKIVELVCRRIPARFGLDPIRDVQVLCPMNRGRVGARSLNLDLQAALNGDPGKPAVERFGGSFRSGDKVMQTVNDYDKDIFNGDLGFVKAVDLEEQELIIDFDGRLVATTSVNWTRSSPPMRSPFTSRRARNIRRW